MLGILSLLLLLLVHRIHGDVPLLVIHDDRATGSQFTSSWLELLQDHMAAPSLQLKRHVVEYNMTQADDFYEDLGEAVRGAGGVVVICRCLMASQVLAGLANIDKEIPILQIELDYCLDGVVRPGPTNNKLEIIKMHETKIKHRFSCLVKVATVWSQSIIFSSFHLVRARLPWSPKEILTEGDVEARRSFVACAGANQVTINLPPDKVARKVGASYLLGITLKIVMLNRPPFVIYKKEPDGRIPDKVDGFLINLLKTLEDKYHFRHSFHEPYDGQWGKTMENGTWNGMVGQVKRGEMDIGLCSFTVSQIRETVIDFSYPYYEEPTAIALPLPKDYGQLYAVTRPWGVELWLSTCITIAVVFITLYIIKTFEYKEETTKIIQVNKMTQEKKSGKRRRKTSGTYKYFHYTVGALINESYTITQRGRARKIVVGLWGFVALVLLSSYNGSLISFLTIPRLTNLVDTLDQLVKQTEVDWTFRRNTAHHALFLEAQAGTYKKIGDLYRGRESDLITSNDVGFENAALGKTAYIKEKSWLLFKREEDRKERGKCRISIAKQEFFTSGFAVVLPSGSPFKPIFDEQIMRLRESGIISKWKKDFWPPSGRCQTDDGVKKMTLENLQSCFAVYVLGIISAISCFGIEYICHFMFSKMFN